MTKKISVIGIAACMRYLISASSIHNLSEYNKWRKMLISGIVFAFITMALGEIPIGWAKYPETGNELLNIIIGSGNLSILQMASGTLFGGIFIPLQYYGFKAIAFGGGTVHVLSVALMFVCKLENTGNINNFFSGIISRFILLIIASVLFAPAHILISYKNAKC